MDQTNPNQPNFDQISFEEYVTIKVIKKSL